MFVLYLGVVYILSIYLKNIYMYVYQSVAAIVQALLSLGPYDRVWKCPGYLLLLLSALLKNYLYACFA